VDTSALEKRVKQITDHDLLASLRLEAPGLAGMRAAARGSDALAPWRAWREYAISHRLRRTLPRPSGPREDAAAGDPLR
jgi:hypothetical protein